jgi:small-conductance mechanosensitive channel
MFISLNFIRLSLVDLPLPHLVLITTCGSLAFIIHTPTNSKMQFRELVILLSIIAAITLTIIAATISPSAYIEQVPPATRTRIITRFVMIAGLAIGAWIGGYYLRQYLIAPWQYWIVMIIILFAYIYAIRSISISTEKIYIYRERALLWDERDQLIRQAQDQGMVEIDVRGIDGLPVGGIRDFKPKAGNWVNGCAASYYGIKEIRATLP